MIQNKLSGLSRILLCLLICLLVKSVSSQEHNMLISTQQRPLTTGVLAKAYNLLRDKQPESAYLLLRRYNLDAFQPKDFKDSSYLSAYFFILASHFKEQHTLDSAYIYFTKALQLPHQTAMDHNANMHLFHIVAHLGLKDLANQYLSRVEQAGHTLQKDHSRYANPVRLQLFEFKVMNDEFHYLDSLLYVSNNDVFYQKKVTQMSVILLAFHPDSLAYLKTVLQKIDTSILTPEAKAILNNKTNAHKLKKHLIDNHKFDGKCTLDDYEVNLIAYNYYKEEHNQTKAFQHLESAFQLSDSIRLTQLYILSLEYEQKLKTEGLIAQQQQKLLQKEGEIIKNRSLMIISIVISLIIIMSIWAYLRYKHKMDQLKFQRLEEEQKNNALQIIIQTQEEERKRIAEDLHDSLGVLISAGIMHWQALAKTSLADPNHNRLDQEGYSIFTEMRTEIKNIAFNLLPENSASHNLQNAIEKLINRLNTQPAILFRFFSYGNTIQLNTRKNYVLYRMIEEICNNAIKHSNAQNVVIEFYFHDSLLHIHINDDGIGYNEFESNNGMGMHNLKNRAESINATVEIMAFKLNGTTFDIRIEY